MIRISGRVEGILGLCRVFLGLYRDPASFPQRLHAGYIYIYIYRLSAARCRCFCRLRAPGEALKDERI